MKEKLLFVTKGGENCDEGFSYVLQLAKTLNAGISVLMVYSKGAMDTYDDMMAAVAFAEAGDLKTVEELMSSQGKGIREIADKKIKDMCEKCADVSIDLTYRMTAGDIIAEIKDFLKGRHSIEMVLLSPSLSESKKGADIKKLLRNITRPIVTITRPARAEI